MSASDSLAELMGRLRSGEDGAAREVFIRFAGRLVGLARRHLDARLAVKVDPEDVVQSAYKSFFVRHRDGGLEVGSWDGLWGVLTVITLRKCADRAAYYRAEKRDVGREAAAAADDSALPGAALALGVGVLLLIPLVLIAFARIAEMAAIMFGHGPRRLITSPLATRDGFVPKVSIHVPAHRVVAAD